jgi:uncharacterized protein with beta-barrel porin domain
VALPDAARVSFIDGAAQASDAALVTGSAEMNWLNGFSLAATFEGEFSSFTGSYAGKGVVRYAWREPAMKKPGGSDRRAQCNKVG